MKISWVLLSLILWGSGIAPAWAGCPQGQRAQLRVTVDTRPRVLSAADVRDLAADLFDDQGLAIVQPDVAQEALLRRQKELIAMGDAVGALELVHKLGANWLVSVRVRGRQRPIEGLAAGLYNVDARAVVEILSADTGRELAKARGNRRKAGLGLGNQLPGLLEGLLPKVIAKAIREACAKVPAGKAPKVPPEEDEDLPAAGAASPVDSL